MTSPESIVVDLAHAKLLKEAGWPQEMSYFVVFTIDSPSASANALDYFARREDDLGLIPVDELFAAPTASELLHHIEAETGWDRQQSLRRLSEFVGTAPDRILSNDVADWWCYLAKNGLLPTEA